CPLDGQVLIESAWERTLPPRRGLYVFPLATHGLRRGLHSDAASPLTRTRSTLFAEILVRTQL
ncbi:MAG: hypothetical protein WB781_15105, partial [Candidatus Sulfotelmatobacter sp.]